METRDYMGCRGAYNPNNLNSNAVLCRVELQGMGGYESLVKFNSFFSRVYQLVITMNSMGSDPSVG